MGPGVFRERAKSSVCATVRVAIWRSSVRRKSAFATAEVVVLRTFFVVNDLALVVFCHIVSIDASVAYITVDSGVILPLVCDGLEESRAARTRATENQTHLAWLEQPGLPERPIISVYVSNYSDSRTWHIRLEDGHKRRFWPYSGHDRLD